MNKFAIKAIAMLTASHALARKRLESGRVLLITGAPGIGKSTLAEQLCLEYVVEGFELCVASDNVKELEAVYKIDSKQVFYFDDFLGSNYLQFLNRNEDSHIVGFVKRVRLDATKRFVLTSRTTVLNRGKMLTDKFSIEKIDRNELELHVDSYSELDKALLLHGFLWFSGLDPEFIDAFRTNRRYWDVIRHKNFNPRLVAFITDPHRLESVSASAYWQYILDKLQNPADVWAHAYDNQINDWCRAMLWLTVLSGNNIQEDRLQVAVERLSREPIASTFSGEHDYARCMSLLIGSFLNRTHISPKFSISLFNPSIADYVLRRISGSPGILTGALNALRSSRPVRQLGELVNSKIASKAVANEVISNLTNSISADATTEEELDFGAMVASCMYDNKINDPVSLSRVLEFLKRLSKSDKNSAQLPIVANALAGYFSAGLLSTDDVRGYFENLNTDLIYGGDFEEAIKVLEIVLPDYYTDAEETFKSAIVSHWQDAIGEEIHERGKLSQYLDENDAAEARRVAEDEVNEILGRYSIDFSRDDIKAILSYCDISDMINDNIRREMNDYRTESRRVISAEQPNGDIDDLFSIDVPPGAAE